MTELQSTVDKMDTESAIAYLNDYLKENGEIEEAYILRGIRYWGMGERALAINDYLSAIRINPESRARQALEAANEILDYRNKDLYNP